MEASPKTHLPSVALLALSGLGLLTALGISIVALMAGIMMVVGKQVNEAIPLFSIGWTAGLVALLCLPALGLTLLRLFDRPVPPWATPRWYPYSSLLLIVWPLFLLVGSLLAQNKLAWIGLPVLTTLVVGIPLWWLIEMGRNGLDSGGPQRGWGILNFGLMVTPFTIIVVELIFLLGLGLLAGLAAISNQSLIQEFTQLGIRLGGDSQIDPELLNQTLLPLLQKPWVIYILFAVTSGFIPLIEEAFKPLALWPFAGKFTPAQGFVAGLISGAAFAFIESVGYLSPVSGVSWSGVAIGRLGTGLLHTVSSGLVGWGLAMAWHEKRYWQLGLAYFTAVLLHGLWNTFGLLMGIGAMISSSSSNSTLAIFKQLFIISPLALGIMVITLFGILLVSRHQLRTEIQKTN